MIAILLSFFFGAITMLGYILWRMMRNDGWDDSNITNALRLLSHVTLHSEDFGSMFYVHPHQLDALDEYMPETVAKIATQRPFWYVSEDEFEGVVKTRP